MANRLHRQVDPLQFVALLILITGLGYMSLVVVFGLAFWIMQQGG